MFFVDGDSLLAYQFYQIHATSSVEQEALFLFDTYSSLPPTLSQSSYNECMYVYEIYSEEEGVTSPKYVWSYLLSWSKCVPFCLTYHIYYFLFSQQILKYASIFTGATFSHVWRKMHDTEVCKMHIYVHL